MDWPPAGPGLKAIILEDSPGLDAADLERSLSGRELAEARGKRAPAARRAWLLGRLAAKLAGAALWATPPELVEIRRSLSGRPELWLPGSAEPAGFLTISHTADGRRLAAGAVAGRPGLYPGLDLEFAGRLIGPKAAEYAFDRRELALADEAGGALDGPAWADSPAAGPEERRNWPLLALWCAKEAAAKSWGLGLLDHLEAVRALRADWPAGRLTVGLKGRESGLAEVEIKIRQGLMSALSSICLCL